MVTGRLTERLRRYVTARVGAEWIERLEALAAEGIQDNQDAERVLTAIVLVAGEDLADFERAVALARIDWRDLLVAAGLADADWPDRLALLLD